jgi:hypothetical protein
MANISLLSRLVNGVQRQVDLSSNTLVVQAIQINGTLLSSSGATAGSTLVGDNNSYTNFTPLTATVKGALSAIDTAIGAAGNTPLDGTFRIENTADPTKKIAFSAAGLTTGTTRTITMPDANVDLGNLTNSNIAAAAAIAYSKLATLGGSTNAVLTQSSSGFVQASAILSGNLFLADGSVTATANFNLGGFEVQNLGTPTNPNDAATKAYVDNFINATSWKTAVLVATTANITLSGEQTIDGFLTSSSRVLVKNQSTASQNGIYVSGSGAWTRSSDMSSWTQVPAAAVFVEEGTVNADLGFVCVAQPGGTIGTTAINFVQFSSAGAYSADGITLQLISGVFSIKNAGVTETQIASSAFSATGAITGGSGTKIAVNVDGTSIDINGSNQIEIKNAGVTAAKLGAVTDGVTLDQSGAGSTIEIKASGVSATQLATGAFDQATITGGAGSAAQVAYSPSIKIAGVAGQTFAANTTYALRYGLPANGETAGRLYAADISTGSFDLFWVVGFLPAGAGFSAGGAILYVESGALTLGSSDTNFGSNDPGKPIFLQSGGIQPTTTSPSTTGQAVAAIGMVLSTTSFKVMIRAPYVY